MKVRDFFSSQPHDRRPGWDDGQVDLEEIAEKKSEIFEASGEVGESEAFADEDEGGSLL